MFRVGEVVGGDFEIQRPLSQGGMGAVFLARQLSTDALRAIKVMLPEWSQRAELRVRFEREARVSGRIESEHVVKIVAYGIDRERQIPWLAMEYLHGATLEGRMAEFGVPAPAIALTLLRQLFHGVCAAHALGIVHRDLKPSNVFVADSQRADAPHTVKVLDFGIAKILGREPSGTQAMGTQAWKAPEQDQPGMILSPSADVWALGLLVFWLLNGREFWHWVSDAPARLSYEVHFESIPPAWKRSVELGRRPLSGDFDAWFSHCVARDPAQRFTDARPCWNALQRIWPGLLPSGSSTWIGPDRATPSVASARRGRDPSQQATLSVRPEPEPTFPRPPESARTTEPPQIEFTRPPTPSKPRSLTWRALLGIAAAGSLFGLGFIVRAGIPGPQATLPAEPSAGLLGATGSAEPGASSSASPVRVNSSEAPVPPSDMVYVAPGTFEMGTDASSEQAPRRSVRLTRGFFLDRTEETVRDYARCVASKKCTVTGVHGPSPEIDDPVRYGKYCNADRPGYALHPINCLDRLQAAAFCHFVSKRLPTEAEWERAARGSDGRLYPWGNELPTHCSMGVISGLCPATGTQPAGSRSLSSASPFGALDMSGNLWEWVADGWETDPARVAGNVDPIVPGTTERGLLRGGSWDFARTHATTTRRLPLDVGEGHVSMGVRCARDL